MKSHIYKYHLPWRKRISLLILLIGALLLIFTEGIDKHFVIIVASSLFVPLVGIWFISDLKISNEGIVLNRINKLAWSDVTEAFPFTFLGLSLVRIKRAKGSTWSIPLYFIGERPIKEALLKNVPQHNPLYGVVNLL